MPCTRREAIKTIVPGGWLLSAKDAGTLDCRKFDRAGRIGLGKDFLLVGGSLATACAAKESWSPGKLERKLSYRITGPEGTIPAEVLFYTRRAEINERPLQELMSLFHQQGGVLPGKFSILLIEKDLPGDPEALGQTNSQLELIIVSFGRLFATPDIYVPKGYTPESIANGILTAEVCNLMFSESEQLPAGIPLTRDNTEKLCDSVGVMVAAIAAGKTHSEYTQDASHRFIYRGRLGDLFRLDPETYRRFREALQEPLLKFK